MSALIEFLNLILACVILYYIGRAVKAVIECEKHLRTIAWETQKRARQENNEPPMLG